MTCEPNGGSSFSPKSKSVPIIARIQIGGVGTMRRGDHPVISERSPNVSREMRLAFRATATADCPSQNVFVCHHAPTAGCAAGVECLSIRKICEIVQDYCPGCAIPRWRHLVGAHRGDCWRVNQESFWRDSLNV